MPRNRCIVCSATRCTDPGISLHRFPISQTVRNRWLSNLNLEECAIKPHSQVCSRHFPDGDTSKYPSLMLGKRFASPRKKFHPRAKRARARDMKKEILQLQSSATYRSVTPSGLPTASPPPVADQPALVVSVGEQLEQDYQVHELPDRIETTSLPVSHAKETDVATAKSFSQASSISATIVVNSALLARIEALESEKKQLEAKLSPARTHFRIEQIQHDDGLVHFYTGFVSFFVLNVFFEFLGPVVDKLHYWGTREGHR